MYSIASIGSLLHIIVKQLPFSSVLTQGGSLELELWEELPAQAESGGLLQCNSNAMLRSNWLLQCYHGIGVESSPSIFVDRTHPTIITTQLSAEIGCHMVYLPST